METEAKFDLIEDGTAEMLSTVPVLGRFRLGSPETLHLADHYVDTAERDCFFRGYDCRLRISENGVTVTLKGTDETMEAGSAGVFRREEIEQRLPVASIEPSLWPPGPARRLVEQLRQGRPLIPVLTLCQERLMRSVLDNDREIGILTVDHVLPELAGHDLREYMVVELELGAHGTDDDLETASAVLRSIPGLQPSTQSKFARGMELLQQTAIPG